MSKSATSSTTDKSAQEAEYMQLYQHMQAQAAANTAASPAAPTPEAFVAALSSAAAASDAAESDSDDDDPEADRQSFVFPGLSLTPAALLSFRLSAWHPILRKHTIPTRFVPLSNADFVDYLIEDGVWIPEELAPVKPGNFLGRDSAYDSAADRKAEAARWRATVEEMHPSDDEAEEAAEEAAAAKQLARQSQPFFPELVAQIQSAMTALGGEVFPSLDWHAPTDASWISTERLTKCQTVGDILLLLKSSDKVQEEVEDPFFECSKVEAAAAAAESAAAASTTAAPAATVDAASAASSASSTAAAADPVASFFPTLALRKWSTLHPSKLFRCFLWRGQLLAISQLSGDFYQFLQGIDEREAIQDAIEGWIEDENIGEKLRSAPLGIENAVLDLYIDLSERVWIVKIKPFWPSSTDSLLFTWKEIHQLTVEADREAEKTQRKNAEMRAAVAAAPPMPAMSAMSSSSSSSSSSSAVAASSLALPSTWPVGSILSVPFRVVDSAGAGLDVLRAVGGIKARFPAEGFDLSDGPAIERWIQRVEHGDLKQK